MKFKEDYDNFKREPNLSQKLTRLQDIFRTGVMVQEMAGLWCPSHALKVVRSCDPDAFILECSLATGRIGDEPDHVMLSTEMDDDKYAMAMTKIHDTYDRWYLAKQERELGHDELCRFEVRTFAEENATPDVVESGVYLDHALCLAIDGLCDHRNSSTQVVDALTGVEMFSLEPKKLGQGLFEEFIEAARQNSYESASTLKMG